MMEIINAVLGLAILMGLLVSPYYVIKWLRAADKRSAETNARRLDHERKRTVASAGQPRAGVPQSLHALRSLRAHPAIPGQDWQNLLLGSLHAVAGRRAAQLLQQVHVREYRSVLRQLAKVKWHRNCVCGFVRHMPKLQGRRAPRVVYVLLCSCCATRQVPRHADQPTGVSQPQSTLVG
jgi:hypothetical protein